MSGRTLIFISHANPQDNAFVTWLASRLSLAGYNVWADIVQLSGGERFWRDIEDAIRNHAAKVIVVLSNASVTKEGVRNEIHMATQTGNAIGDVSFVIPAKLDDVASNRIPAQLVQLNYIPFDVEWAAGFAKLLDRLQRSAVACSPGPEAAPLAAWRSFHTRHTTALVSRTETIVSNWFAMSDLPPNVFFYGTDALQDAYELAKKSITKPFVEYLRLIMSFADLDVLQDQISSGVKLRTEYVVPTDKFLAGGEKEGPLVAAGDASRMMVNIIRQAWEKHAITRGLARYEMANRSAWYVPRSLPNAERMPYTDLSGRVAWRALTGHSAKRKFYWHLGLDPMVRLNEPRSIGLRSHVILTNDGAEDFLDKKIMNRRRRSFCKNWWNPRWQGMVAAAAQLLEGEEKCIRLDTGGQAPIVVDATPMQFQLPVSLTSDVPETDLDSVSGIEADPDADDLDEEEPTDDDAEGYK
jgi:TIR domain